MGPWWRCTCTWGHTWTPRFTLFTGGDTIDSLSLDRLVGDAIGLDLLNKEGQVPIAKSDLEVAVDRLQEDGMTCERGDRVILCTGHHERTWGSFDYWNQSPYLTEEAAQWIVDEGFSAAGYDFLQEIPDNLRKPDEPGPIHTRILGNSIYNIEYLTGLDRVAGRKFWLSAAPLLLKGVEGGPARAYAVLDE